MVYLGLGAISALVWARLANVPVLPSWHADMVGGTAPAPNQYRPLTPWVAEALSYLMPSGNPVAAYFTTLFGMPAGMVEIAAVYATLRGVVTGVTLICFDRYLRTWLSPGAAAAGAMCLAAILPFTYLRVVQESDPVNLLVFVLAFWALAKGRDLLLIPLVLIGTVNRETAAMIPGLYLVARWRQRPPWEVAWRTAAMAAAWAAAYGGILLLYGRREYYCDVVMLWLNLSSWAPTAHLGVLFGAMWILAVLGAQKGPLLLRRSLWLLPPYLVLHYIVAMVIEVRLFLPFAPAIIPLSWWVLFPETRSDTAGRSKGRPARK